MTKRQLKDLLNRYEEELEMYDQDVMAMKRNLESAESVIKKMRGFKDNVVVRISFMIGEKVHGKEIKDCREAINFTYKDEEQELIFSGKKGVVFVLSLVGVDNYWIEFFELKEEVAKEETPKKLKKVKKEKEA